MHSPHRFLIRLWLVSIVLILISYHFIDRSLASFIYLNQWRVHLAPLAHVVEWPPVVSGFSPFLLLVLLWKNRLKTDVSPFQKMLLLLALSVIFTYVLKNDFKWVFSRYWPETWKNNNLSWIQDHAYGFQWFQGSPFQGADVTGSFPSGHASVSFATFTAIGLSYRRLLKLCLLLASLEALAMVVFNYHFLSDVIAGAALGTTCTYLCAGLLSSIKQ